MLRCQAADGRSRRRRLGLRLEVPRPSWDDLTAWCFRHLNAAPTEELFEETHLSAVIGLRLSDGREVVVKARPPAARIDSCHGIHRHLYEDGFPCAEPLVAPQPLGGLVATAERLVEAGETMAESPERPRLFAAALQRLAAARRPSANPSTSCRTRPGSAGTTAALRPGPSRTTATTTSTP